MAYISRFVVCVSFFGVMLTVMPAVATDDVYLKMIESEANSVELGGSGQLRKEDNKNKSAKSFFSGSGALEGEDLPKGLEQQEFESLLEENFFGTYAFFNKLNTTDKNTVYYRYSKAEKPGLENVRKNVMSLLKR